jgi:hypothetical protein
LAVASASAKHAKRDADSDSAGSAPLTVGSPWPVARMAGPLPQGQWLVLPHPRIPGKRVVVELPSSLIGQPDHAIAQFAQDALYYKYGAPDPGLEAPAMADMAATQSTDSLPEEGGEGTSDLKAARNSSRNNRSRSPCRLSLASGQLLPSRTAPGVRKSANPPELGGMPPLHSKLGRADFPSGGVSPASWYVA